MGTILRLANDSSTSLTIQVELSAIERELHPGGQLVVDTDIEAPEEIEIQVKDGRIVVWGGVVSDVIDK